MDDTVQSQSDPAAGAVAAKGKLRKLRLVLVLTGSVGAACLAYILLTVFVFFNLHEVVPGQVYRSSQPSPAFLAKVVREKQLRAILKLNSKKESAWSKAEEAVIAGLGVEFIHVGVGVTELPNRHELIDIVRAIDAAPRPLLVHCKTGADRTGLASAMARMREGDSFDQATATQLKWRYLHVGHFGEAIEDVFVQYRADRAAAGLGNGGWAEFKTYVLDEYYPDFYHAGIEPALTEIQGGPGESVTVDVTVTNRSRRAWPADERRPFRLMLGRDPGSLAKMPVPALGPGESVMLKVPVRVPALSPGKYEFSFDILHGSVTWFALRGSAMTPMSVTVKDPALAQSGR